MKQSPIVNNRKEICPYCNSSNIVKNGKCHNSNTIKQNYLCRECGKQHREGDRRHSLKEETVSLIHNMLRERVSGKAIARILNIGEKTVRRYSKEAYIEEIDKGIIAKNIETDCKTNICKVVIDEAWSFVAKKKSKKWVWQAIDASTKQSIAMVVGGRNKVSANKLFESLPEEWKEHAFFFTDDYQAYVNVLPAERHIVDDAPHQNIVENFFMRLRSRLSRMVRKTVSFSKKLFNHIAALTIVTNDLNKSYY